MKQLYISSILLFYLPLHIICEIYFTPTNSINKCCPNGQSYDHSERLCIQNPYFTSGFQHFFGNQLINFETKIPDCTDDEVFVEYFSTIHTIQIEGNNLRVNDDILPPDKFCIEDMVNVVDSRSFMNQFIVRSCRSRSTCGYLLPCIRRCCKTDQIMTPKKLCLPHPNNKNLIPTFHDVELPINNTQRQINLNGM